MEQSTTSKPLNRTQPSIRSFFQPRLPTYAAPPPTTSSRSSVIGPSTPKSMSTVIPSPKVNLQPDSQADNNIPKSTLPKQASISAIQENHIQQLKRINVLLLPINYPDSFYHKILDPKSSPSFSRVILWQDTPRSTQKVVGGIVCRLEKDETSRTTIIYIQSLALLSPYRAYGLATAALEDIIKSLVHTSLTDYPVTSLYAHVWVENTDALAWYLSRGFTKEEPVIQGYYLRLNPGNAWILRRSLGLNDHLRHTHSRTAPTSTVPPSLPIAASAPPLTTPSTETKSNLPRGPSPSTSSPIVRAASYQTAGPGHEWNDLPEEILQTRPVQPSEVLLPPLASLLNPTSNSGSAASSRSSSSTRAGGKKKRQYPAAAFGGAVNGSGNA